MCNKNNFNETMREYAEYIALMNQAKEQAEQAKKELIDFMESEQIDTLQGIEHKASYKKVVANRIDTKALKLDLPEVCDKYTKKSESMRFNFS